MLRRFLIGFALWTIVAVLFAGQLATDAAYSGNRIDRRDALVLAFTGWYAWAVLYPLVAWLARRFRPNVRGIGAHAVLSIVIALAKIALVSELLRAFGMPQRSVSMLVNIPVNLGAYWLIVGVTWALEANLRSARLEASLAATRLDLLRTQIQPHFLFNTLHGIAELMHEDVDAADKMVTRLSELLRATLETGGKQEVSLREELSLLERYIDIQRMRLGERLRFRADVDAHALDRAVPMLLLQPLVENSVRHAIAGRRDGGRIEIRAREANGRLTIEIEDDGPGFGETPGNGIGLANVRDRLQHLYGAEQSMRIASGAGGGGLIQIEIPLREHATDSHAHR
ncbi:MAG TPA: histidine kinase [Vicinamibacterales bacterium]|nr:histidine kinase [Vicinamibacterales bacterium]